MWKDIKRSKNVIDGFIREYLHLSALLVIFGTENVKLGRNSLNVIVFGGPFEIVGQVVSYKVNLAGNFYYLTIF